MIKEAVIDETGQYRYFLTRVWSRDPPVVFIMLNPSTADAEEDDPTIKRCMGFAKSWGYGGIYVVNVFAFRATDPKQLLKAVDPAGPKNNEYIDLAMGCALLDGGIVIAAWGAAGPKDKESYEKVFKIAEKTRIKLGCLGMTKDGKPRHPLYLKGDTLPMPLKGE